MLPVVADDDAGPGELTVETPDLPQTLYRLTAAAGVSADAVLIAAHAKVLVGWCGGVNAVLGLRATDTRAVLPLRVSTAGRTWRDLLRAAEFAYGDLMDHHTYPLDLLRSELGVVGPEFTSVLRLGAALAEPAVDQPLCIDVDPSAPERMRLRFDGAVLDESAAARIGWDHLRALAAMTIDLDAAHDAELPEIRLARPRSAPVSVR
jgi:hypothetical protein